MEGWLRQVSIVTLAIVKALGTAVAKQKLGIESETASILAEILTDIAVDNAFGHVISELRKHNPRNFVDSLANVAGRRAVSIRPT